MLLSKELLTKESSKKNTVYTIFSSDSVVQLFIFLQHIRDTVPVTCVTAHFCDKITHESFLFGKSLYEIPTFSKVLNRFVVIHDTDVYSIQHDEKESFVPLNVLVVHYADKYRYCDSVG